jgi:ABC-2 type transport system ATP-binding protein
VFVAVLGGSGPQLGVLGSGPLGALLGLPSGAKAINALNLTTPKSATTNYVVGAPKLTLTYSGIGTSRHVYAQLVDDTFGPGAWQHRHTDLRDLGREVARRQR